MRVGLQSRAAASPMSTTSAQQQQLLSQQPSRGRRRRQLCSDLVSTSGGPLVLRNTSVRGGLKAPSSRLSRCGISTLFLLAALGWSLTEIPHAEAQSSSEGGSSGFGPSIAAVNVAQAELEPGETFTATWWFSSGTSGNTTTGDLNSFEFALIPCADENLQSCCTAGETATIAAELCLREAGCMDSDGSYDLVVPDSPSFIGDFFLLRISLALEADSVFACTPTAFEVIEAEESGPTVDIGGGTNSSTTSSNAGSGAVAATATLEVFAPEGDIYPGDAFTATWLYEDADGVADAGNFAVDLYTCEDGACDDGSCGVLSASLCGEEGCYDPGTGDYDVVAPADANPGTFTLFVEELSDGGPADCAYFDILRVPGSPTPAPTRVPTVAPTLAPIPSPSPKPTVAPVADTAAPVLATVNPSAAPMVPPVSPTQAPAAASASAPTLAPVAGSPGSPGVPPTAVPTKPVCSANAALTFTYEADEATGAAQIEVRHASDDRTEQGCLTFTLLYEWIQTGEGGVPSDLLYPVDPTTGEADTSGTGSPTGVWLLRSSLDVQNGVILNIKSVASGGDCDELKISSAATQAFRLRGYGGSLDFFQTQVRGWEEDTDAVHALGADSNGGEPRSYVSCVSEELNEADTCEGAATKDMGECRMDVVESEMGYLGYSDTEAYGITWKVRGLCTDLSNLEVFDRVNVYGDITDSNIHHMWYGMYSYGHQGGVWTGNLMHDNHVYGFDPHDDSDYLTIRNNTVWNNGKHGIIASKRCDHLSIVDNDVDTSGGSGIMLHRSCDDSEVIGNTVRNSGDCGLALVETSRTSVTENSFYDNKWGVRLTLGSTDNQIFSNNIENSTSHDIYAYKGSDSDEPYVSPFTGINTDNTFDDNTITYSSTIPVNLEDSSGTIISNNAFVGSGGHFEFEDAVITDVIGNTGEVVDGDHIVIGTSCFTASTSIDPTCA